MGLPINIHVRAGDVDSPVVARGVEAAPLTSWTRRMRCSAPTSATARTAGFAEGNSTPEADPLVVSVCHQAGESTKGAFTDQLPGDDGVLGFDPTGWSRGGRRTGPRASWPTFREPATASMQEVTSSLAPRPVRPAMAGSAMAGRDRGPMRSLALRRGRAARPQRSCHLRHRCPRRPPLRSGDRHRRAENRFGYRARPQPDVGRAGPRTVAEAAANRGRPWRASVWRSGSLALSVKREPGHVALG